MTEEQDEQAAQVEQDGTYGEDNPQVALDFAIFLAPEDRTEEQKALVAKHEAELKVVESATAVTEEVKTSLGESADKNKRELLITRILIALIEGEAPEPADVGELKRVYGIAQPYVNSQ